MTLIPVPPGEVATVVTMLEMRARPRPAPVPDAALRMIRWESVRPAAYRALFERVGGPWLWYSRLAMDDAALAAAVGELHVVIDRAGIEVGMVELDFAEAGDCLIRFLGLVPELAGRGHGRWLFHETLARAWRRDIGRVRVSTCTLDHPAALKAYLRAGFVATGRMFESFPDPRAAGLLPAGAAPQVPLVEPPAS